ncbi:uncharacterized protein LOC134750634 [Cydia strobilella]|uniref:uncharacterized protein LOC134750634 n=1 Tax=Cydia strobilella TaxID=1100964 RepID=UPI0030059ED7
MIPRSFVTVIILLLSLHTIMAEEGYLRYVKDGCFLRGEALSCVKYKALKVAKKTLFGDDNGNETIRANNMISFVPLDQETVDKLNIKKEEMEVSKPRGFLSEWAELTKYAVKVVKEFFRMKGMKVNLPEGARTIEEEDVDDGRGRKKKLAVVVPLLTLLAALKTKLLLIPILLAVLLIKKLLLIAAVLLPGLLSTLKACKHHHHHSPSYSYFGGSDTSDFNSDYGSSYAYSSGNGYAKDWAANRAYNMQKPRQTPAPMYITAPGGVA